MNITALLPVAQQLFPNELNAFYRARAAVGASLNEQGQQFVIDNWRGMVDFMETDAGKQAIVQFMDT